MQYEGITGTQTKNRAEFNKMIKMCQQGKIDLILTKSISRFARNTVDCLNFVRALKAIDVAVMFEKENINTLSMESETLISLLATLAQAESESISGNVKWGVRKGFKQGKALIHYNNLLGYEKGVKMAILGLYRRKLKLLGLYLTVILLAAVYQVLRVI